MLDFMKIEALMSEAAAIKDELKREVEKVVEARGDKSLAPWAAARAKGFLLSRDRVNSEVHSLPRPG
ncbi:hypothetical protein [Mesorhizobium sp. M0678]|uniref:hypothetical protein n=1 Tax=unclassified Mesorhizobium TaxID=325217 RepID=UPI00333990AE